MKTADLYRMDSSSYTIRLRSRALAHGSTAKGVSDGELVARRSARIVRECCSSALSESQQSITDPLAFVFDIEQTRAIRTMTLSLQGSGVILSGSTQIRFTGSYNGSITAGARVAIYSSNLLSCIFEFNIPTYHSMTGYYLPAIQSIKVGDNNYITSINFIQNAPSLVSFATVNGPNDWPQPLQITSFNCENLPILETLVLANQSGPLNAILNAPDTLKNLQVYGNSFIGTFSVPGIALEFLICSDNRITALTNIPNSLKELYAGQTDISGVFSLFEMPNLQFLDINSTRVSGLSNIPTSLTSLYISQTDISGVFDLAVIPYITSFNANNTHITSLTNIPLTIVNIIITSTDISGVFDLGGLSALTLFFASQTYITSLINIPANLTELRLQNTYLIQSESDAIASVLDTNGKTGGRLTIVNQQNSIIIDISGPSYTSLIAKGWLIN